MYLLFVAQSILFDRGPQRATDRSSLPIVQRERYKVFRPRRYLLSHPFSDFGTGPYRIYCGFEDAIEVFDVHRPGNDEGTRLHTTPSKKAKDGLKGQSTPPSVHDLFNLRFSAEQFAYRDHIVHRVLPGPNERILRSRDIDSFQLQHRPV